jgi:Fic family protein
MGDELSALLAQIDAKRALLAERRPLSAGEAARLREYLDVEWTYHTNSIEGSTLTRQETLVVLKHGLTVGGKTLVEHLEATNHQHAIDHVIQLATRSTPPTETDILASTTRTPAFIADGRSSLLDPNISRPRHWLCPDAWPS